MVDNATSSIHKLSVDTEEGHSPASLVEDKLYLQMCKNKKTAIVDIGTRNERKINWYYHEAAKYAGRISAGDFSRGRNKKFRPVFRIYFSTLTPRLVTELKILAKEDVQSFREVVKNAVFRIFRARHEMIFYQYIEAAPFLFEFLEGDENEGEDRNDNHRIGGSH
jgi:hypothetical protein